MTYVTVTTNVEVDISNIDDDDLCCELADRGYVITNNEDTSVKKSLIEDLYNAYTMKKTDKVDSLLIELFYSSIGRIA